MMHVRVAVTFVNDAISKIVSFVTEGELKGSSFLLKCPKG